MWLVVGLGNPGSEYAHTRHNAGFLVVEELARELRVQLKTRAFHSRLAEARLGGSQVVLALPQTYMNLSGVAVKELLSGYRLKPENLVVVYDDLDLNLGQIRVRARGSAGSHKGLKSIIQEIGTPEFPRVRIGIGPKPEGLEAADYVLSPFTQEELEPLGQGLNQAREAIRLIISGQLPQAMNLFNRRKKEPVSDKN